MRLKKKVNKIDQLGYKIFSKFYTLLRESHERNNLNKAVQNGVVTIGPNSYGVPMIKTCAGYNSTVRIGNFCSIAHGVKIFAGCSHISKWVSTFPFRIMLNLPGAFKDGQPGSKGDVVIGNDVWISEDVVILSGVTIGDGAIVGAGSVVTSDLPPYSISVGVPAKVIKFRFDGESIEKLMTIKWWEWCNDKIIENINLLSSPDVSRFIERFSEE